MTHNKNMFHDLLNLVSEFISHEHRVHFYTRVFNIIDSDRIRLDFLLGHDPHFDEAHKKAKKSDSD